MSPNKEHSQNVIRAASDRYFRLHTRATVLILFVFISGLFNPLWSQESDNQAAVYNYDMPLQHIDGDFRFITTDNLLNLYCLNQEGELFLFSRFGKFMFRYSNIRYGEPLYVDASNPLKLLVFYPEYGVIVVLDNTLTELATIEFLRLGYDRVKAVCLAEDNNIWFYDELRFQLVKLDETYNVVYTSEPLNNTLGIGLKPVDMFMRNKWLYLNDPAYGIYVFDLFGTWSNQFEFRDVGKFQTYGNFLLMQFNNEVTQYNMRTREQKQFPLPTDSLRSFRLEKNRLFLLNKGGIDVYLFEYGND